MSKKLKILISAGMVVLILVGGFYFWQKSKAPKQKACTMEAKLCPDGSSVGRTGLNCEFATCSEKTGVQNKPVGGSLCEKSGGKIVSINECNGSISYACSFPDGQICYEENLKGGKCIGSFSPKVLCDNE